MNVNFTHDNTGHDLQRVLYETMPRAVHKPQQKFLLVVQRASGTKIKI